MKTLRWFLGIILSLILVVTTLTITYAAQKKPIELRWCTFFPPAHPLFPMSQKWGGEIEKLSGGQVKFTYFPGGTLLKGNEIYDGILKGTVDIGMSCFAYTRGRFPAMEAVDLPLGYTTGTVASYVINEFYNKFKPKELENVKILFLHAHGAGILHSKKPVYKLEDVKGLKIRSTGFSAKVSKALGAVPVAMPMGGTYEALQKGVVEASFAPIEVLKTWKQAEVIKYTTECYGVGYTTGFFVAMNLKTWSSLPKDVQEAFEKVRTKYVTASGGVWDAGDKAGLEYTQSLGNKIIPVSDEENARWAKAIQSVISDYVKKAEGKGLPGEEYVKTLKALIEKYKKQ